MAEKIDPRWAWERYRPSEKAVWDLRRVGHLYRRAAFGASMDELEAGLKNGPEKTIELLLEGGPNQETFERQMAPLAEVIARTNDGRSMRGWWLTRMLTTPHPLREKLTLFWHDHFATSNAKVQSTRFMLGQYELMRKHALGSFAELLTSMSSDPAMLIWLDGRGSKKGNPNENYARELMELFSLGIGHYTEEDIREAARAFTGWEIEGTKAVFNKGQYDDGEKTVLRRRGRWQPDDVVRICLDQPACASFICTKLFRFLVSETISPADELIEPLASEFRKNYDFGALVRRILSSNLFFTDQAYRSRVKSPVDFALGVVKGLEGRIGTRVLADELEKLGQNLFYPPSVKGWDGGQHWLNGQTLLYRQNLALAMTSTEDGRFGTRLDPAELARKRGKTSDEEIVGFFVRLFLQDDVSEETRRRLMDYAKKSRSLKVPIFWTAEDAAAHRIRTLCYLVLTQPEHQLD